VTGSPATTRELARHDPSAGSGDGSEARGSVDLIGTVADWLMDQALGEPELTDLFSGCCARLRAAGVPISRAFIGFRVLHPLVSVMSLVWRPDTGLVTEQFQHDAANGGWNRSPHKYLVEHQIPFMRRRLAGPDAMLDFPLLGELRDQGMTDYFGFVVAFVDAPVHVGVANGLIGSWVSDRPSGFSDGDIHALLRIQRRLSVACKVRIKDMIARNVVTTYLGADAGLRVLNGSIKRGDGEIIRAAVWFSDLRNSTGLAENLDATGYLEALNAYFECAAGAVMAAGGEVLMLIGDAVLAIFPVGGGRSEARAACRAALSAAGDAERRLARLNEARAGRDLPALEFGVGLHVGELMFGNIGLPERLQFTVVGPAANEVSRLQALTKVLGRRVLASRDFADAVRGAWESLGRHAMPGLAAAREVFAPAIGKARSGKARA
jgi:adenylate cyclase